MFPRPKARKRLDVVVVMLVLLATYQLSGATLIKAKALLAPLLIAQAWEQTLLTGGAASKPWPWADTWPVARLRVAALDIDQFVLAGDTGNALAFGPGHTLSSAPLGGAGVSVIGGHRDTHFTFLKHLHLGQVLLLELPSGEQLEYVIQSSRIVDAQAESLPSSTAASDELLLVTCYPFDTLIVGGPLRYVVRAVPNISPIHTSTAPSAGQSVQVL